jgi:sialate O-acetylesterase
MIESWRESWHNATGGIAPKSWPFGFVQLSNHNGGIGTYGGNLTDAGYQGVRWAQTAGYGTAPNPAMPDTFMATAVDIGQEASPGAGPHVQDKQDVGHRLFLAFKKAYLGDDDIFAPGPVASRSVLRSGDVSVSFDNLSPMGFQLLPTQLGFEVLNGTGSWLNVSAVALSANSRDVVLTLPAGMAQPALVRYLWATNPCFPTPGLECPLHDADTNALPALPFVMNITLSSPALLAV